MKQQAIARANAKVRELEAAAELENEKSETNAITSTR